MSRGVNNPAKDAEERAVNVTAVTVKSLAEGAVKNPTKNAVTVVFATGGTGGHIYPALAVARALQNLGYTVHFVGHQNGMEAAIIPETGFSFHGVRAGKWDRARPDPRQGVRALSGLGDALRILRSVKPRAVVGFGGFASFPALAAASVMRLPILLHEGNALPGRVTRLFAGRSRLVGLGKLEAATRLKSANTVYVGMPVREVRVEKQEARARLGLPQEGPVTLVMGGSQGSLTLNERVPEAYEALPVSLRQNLTVLHSSGSRWAEGVRKRVKEHSQYIVHPYLDATLAWSAADVAITRAGIGTLAEAAFHGVPLVMVPLPSSAEDHQRHNAEAVARAGAGRVVLERDIHNLREAWAALLGDETRLEVAEAASSLSPAGAAETFAALIDETLSGESRRSAASSRVQEPA